VTVPYVAVGPMPRWTIDGHVMHHGDGVGSVVDTLRSEAGSCTGNVEDTSLGEGTFNVADTGTDATLGSVEGGGAGLCGVVGTMGVTGTYGCCMRSLKIMVSWVS
jgi:hypothetical protein